MGDNYLQDRFKIHLREDYESNLKQVNDEIELRHLIDFLLDQKLVSKSAMNRYTLQKEFDLLYPSHGFHKTDTINTLATRFNLSESSIWEALRSKKK